MSAPPSLDSASLRPAERRMLERFTRLLQERFGDDLLAVWLYGSRARGEPPAEFSDVDTIVITRDGHRSFNAVHSIGWEAAAAEGVTPPLLSTHVYDPEWVEERRAIDSFFMREVDRDKIVLFGGP